MQIISIIVPIYNAELYIRNCVHSILKQSYEQFELLLVNDGSSDRSWEICQELALLDNRIKIINQPNGGASIARNRGLKESIGEWVVFVDSDDIVTEEYLFNLIEATKSVTTDFVVGGVDHYYVEQDIHEYHKYSNIHWNGQDVIKALTDYNIYENGGPTAKLYNNKILKTCNIRFNPVLHFAEDCDFMLRYITQIKSITFIDAADYTYCIRKESLSHRRLSYSTEIVCLYEMILRYNDLEVLYGNFSLVKYKSSIIQYYIRTLRAISISDLRLYEKYKLTKKILLSCKDFYTKTEFFYYQPYCRYERYLHQIIWISKGPLLFIYTTLTSILFLNKK